MACMRISTILKKWDLLVTLEGKYVCNSFIYTNISRECHVLSALTLRVNYAHNECLYCLRAIYTVRHQPVACTLARSKDFCTRVVHVLLHTRVFVNFKSSCIP